jgi:multidrug efflux pump subunit AcrA (membrane-fusion protein)
MALQKIPIPFHRRADIFRRKALPLLVWVAAALGVVQLLEVRSSTVEFVGVAQVTEYVVSAPSAGSLMEVSVGLYDQVEAGQVIAMMDPELVLAQILTAGGEVERLSAERVALAAQLVIDADEIGRGWEKDARRFEMDAVDLRVDLLRRNIDLATSRVEAERLRISAERALALVESTAGSEAVAEDLALAYQKEQEGIRSMEELVAQLQAEYDLATERSREFLLSAPEDLVVEPRLEVLQRAIEVQELRIAEIEVARAGLVLRAPVYGKVRAILATEGRSIVMGQEVVAVTPTSGDAVVFYQPIGRPSSIAVGTKVRVRKLGDRVAAEAVVTVLSPTIEELPQTLWRDPAIAEFGRAAQVSPVVELGLVPGEPVHVAIIES